MGLLGAGVDHRAMKKQKSEIDGSLIFSKNNHLIRSFKELFKARGVETCQAYDNVNEINDQLHSHKFLIILDWDMGEKECLKVLERANQKNLIGLLPLILVGTEMHPKMIAASYEYSVSKVLLGTPTMLALKAALDETFRYQQQIVPLKELLLKVMKSRKEGKADETLAMLKEAHGRLPGMERIACEYGEELIARSEWDEADKVLGPIVGKQPPYLRAHHSYARVLMTKGKIDEAESLLKKTKLLNPANIGCLVELGEALLQKGDLAGAKENFAKALEVAPESKGAKQGIGKVNLIEGDIGVAMGVLKDVSSPRELASMFNMSAIFNIKDGEFSKAMELYKYSIGLLEEADLQAKLYFNAGLGFRRWKKPERALVCFEKSIELDSSYEKASVHIEKTKTQIAAMRPKVKVNNEDEEDEESIGNISAGSVGGDITVEKTEESDPFNMLVGFDAFEGAGSEASSDEGQGSDEGGEDEMELLENQV